MKAIISMYVPRFEQNILVALNLRDGITHNTEQVTLQCSDVRAFSRYSDKHTAYRLENNTKGILDLRDDITKMYNSVINQIPLGSIPKSIKVIGPLDNE